MSTDPLVSIGETARELQARYGDLLHPRRTAPDPEVERAFDAVRERLHSSCMHSAVPDAQQMTLDVGGR